MHDAQATHGKEAVRMRLWTNERGLTLIELLLAVVILGLVVVPLMNIGTTALTWHHEDVQRNQAVLLADREMQEIKRYVETNGPVLPGTVAGGTDPETGLKWRVSNLAGNTLPAHQTEADVLPDVYDIRVVISGPELDLKLLQSNTPPAVHDLTTLDASARKKATP
jgi:prepilin-type N-terminal cleavage/methylation domain-containing protein